ncbi:chalcone isomerase family protein [Thiomicrospira sp. ALE5]|uniref:chalcone isomerase family protein n=1 Tax=Thiomicrospira sp. ALE5 TaxID=748650 RepID=UPI0008EA7A79|nr:chalcone isomerase family protein [Thiomicrospira sp. ALE5]SFR62790.1 Chalcone isomerase-like [Thiomicrospira sp. ALE5]
MSKLNKFLLALMLTGLTQPVLSSQNWLTTGEGTARWGLIKLYDATLRVAPGMNHQTLLSDTTPLQLELCYARSLTVENFVDGANHALPDNLTAELNRAVEKLHQAYQPVSQGDCYLLDHAPERGTALILNGQELVRINTPGFKAVYFGIWIGESPLSNRLKNNLLRDLP